MAQQWLTTVTIELELRKMSESDAEAALRNILAVAKQHGKADVTRIDTRLVPHRLGFLRRRP